MKQRAPHDRLGQIEAPAAVGEEREPQRLEAAVGDEAGGVARQVRMALAGERHVELRASAARAPAAASSRRRAPRSPPTGSPALPCRRTRRPCAGTRPSPGCAAAPSTRATISCVSDGCCVDECSDDAAALVDPRDRAPASRDRNAPARRSRARRRCAAALDVERGHVAVGEPQRLGEEAARVDRLLDRQDRRQRLVRRRCTRAAPRCAASSVSPSTHATGCR